MSARDPEFARSAAAFDDAKKGFLGPLSGGARLWAEAFLKRAAQVSTYDLRNISGDSDYDKERRAGYLRKRADVTRYMNLMARTAATDPAFLILLRPVCANAVYFRMSQNYVEQILAEYDAHKNDPYRDSEYYTTRKVDGRRWSVIFFPGQEVSTASDSDRNMAFVVRIDGDSFSLSPIIAPVREDVFPGEKHPLRPEKYEYGPGGVSITECRMETALRVTNDDGPFAFQADARQVFTDRGLSYTCEPTCTGLANAWNETTQSFIREDGVCREDDAWKPSSPFDGKNTLIPVADYVQELAGVDAVVLEHGKRVEKAVAAYLALFDGAAQEQARSFTDGWLLDRQFPLYRLVGNRKDFIAAYLVNDQPVLDYLETVVSLAETPDARLTVLLDDFAARLDRHEARKEERGPYQLENKRSPSISDLLRADSKPVWFAAYAYGQSALLREPRKRELGWYSYKASGLEGGEEIVFAYNGRQFYYGEGEVNNTYIMREGSDGAFWGYADVRVGKRHGEYYYDSSYERLLELARRQVFRVADGKIRFVTPRLPEEKEFFTNPQLGYNGEVLWKLPGKRSGRPCSMAPALDVDAASAPFKITAREMAVEEDYGYICVPECSIPFVWDGATYVRGEPECLAEGEWGAKRQERP